MKLRVATLIIGSFALLLSLYPFLVNLTTPIAPGRINLYWDNWPYDFNYYRSIITQGKNGRLTTVDKYTSEKHDGKFIRSSYIVLGHISRLTNTDETFMYHVARIVLGGLFILISYQLISFFVSSLPHVSNFQLLAFLTLLTYLFAAGIPDKVCDPICRYLPRLAWMTQLDPIRRLSFLPHYLWGQIAFIFTLCCFLNDKLKNRRLVLLSSGILLGLAGLDHPPSLGLMYPLLFVSFISLTWKTFWQKNNRIKTLKNYLTDILFIMIGTLPFIIYLFWSTDQLPWNLSRNTSFSLGTNLIHFSLAVGPTYIIGLITGAIILLTPKKIPLSLLICASWIILTAFLSFFASRFGIFAQTRFLQVAIQLPATILTLYSFVWINGTINKRIKLPSLRNNYTFVILGCVMILISSLPTLHYLFQEQLGYIYSMSKQTLSTIPYPPYTDYPPASWIQPMRWLSQHSKPDDIVLSDFTAGNFIPTYAGNTVYYGHEIETSNFNDKKSGVIDFFISSNHQAQSDFLKKNGIKYIFYGPQEKAYRKGVLHIPSTRKVFENNLVTIYEVK